MLKTSAALIIATLFFTSSLSANVQYVTSGGQLTGVNNVDVNGILYDVNFVDGSFDSIFTDASNLDFTTASDAQAASTALMNAITDVPGFNVDSTPTLMNGCSDVTKPCYIFTPYSLTSTPYTDYVNMAVFTNAAIEASDVVWLASIDSAYDVTFSLDDVYADWSLAAVTEPGTLLLMSIGLLGMISMRRKMPV